MSGEFWLYKWIDEFEISSKDDRVTTLLKNRQALEKLHNFAALQASEPTSEPDFSDSDNALVAAHDMDLSDDLDCCSDVSRIAQINREFPKVLHYFDHIIVEGPSAQKYATLLEHPVEATLHKIANHIDGLIYLRETGADEIASFGGKLPPIENYKHWAKEFKISGVTDSADSLIERLASEGKVTHLASSGDHWHFTFRHQLLEHDLPLILWQKKKPTIKRMATTVFDHYASLLTSDVISSRTMRLPLGTNTELSASLFLEQGLESLIAEAALNLYLPVLEDLPLSDIIRLRRDEYDHFSNFQSALRTGIKERLKGGTGDPATVAREVQREIIDPALSRINLRLTKAGSSLTKKASISIGVGTILTSIGLVESVPLIIGSGLAAAATTVGAIHSYIDSRREIELSDMYFLWLLEKGVQAPRHTMDHHSRN
jgi:hypothetical protein